MLISYLHIHLVNLSDDVEKIPGPKSYSAQYLTICHWNLDTETVDCKIGVSRNVAKYTGKRLCQSLFFNKVAGLSLQQPATLLKKRLWHKCFSVSFAKFLKNNFSYRTRPVTALCKQHCSLQFHQARALKSIPFGS